MSTDVPDGPGPGQPERGTRRPPRVGDSGSPVGSTLSIVLAVVAVVAGFLILRNIFDDDGANGVTNPGPRDTSVGGSSTTSLPGGSSSDPASSTPPSVTSPPKDAAVVIVANASGVDGSAQQMSNALESAGYRMAEPTNGTGPDLDETMVFFVRGGSNRGVAELVAADLGGATVRRMPAEIPVQDEDIGRAAVLVMLGSDTAGQSLEDLNPEAVTPPDASGGATTSAP